MVRPSSRPCDPECQRTAEPLEQHISRRRWTALCDKCRPTICACRRHEPLTNPDSSCLTRVATHLRTQAVWITSPSLRLQIWSEKDAAELGGASLGAPCLPAVVRATCWLPYLSKPHTCHDYRGTTQQARRPRLDKGTRKLSIKTEAVSDIDTQRTLAPVRILFMTNPSESLLTADMPKSVLY